MGNSMQITNREVALIPGVIRTFWLVSKTRLQGRRGSLCKWLEFLCAACVPTQPSRSQRCVAHPVCTNRE